ncbi:molybdenum cofactor biosynthesis protein MoaE [Nocardioides panacisoli]|uniref:molybdenum cofactor biosynthesis protein MoaE n=1 Tax=Nocardioides panacisoli TaxID=627624 RepID=UPI001C62C268|nr:molybdenum cofactor biosynthesis protein MoaE [Nocardioides panacisoli]QYJ05716.1 molybdenum cofactor biosynthesis protein MoaE [Nocardioides panacisoli]
MSHPAVRHVAISDTPLSVEEVLGHLDDEASGGVVTFIGRVRDHDRDQGVTGLEYSAHPSALQALQRVCDQVAEEYDARAVAAVHRVGELAVGDLAVVVATAAGHRGSAFDASRALIDTLKAEVPIWKHQRFADGSDEWVGSP